MIAEMVLQRNKAQEHLTVTGINHYQNSFVHVAHFLLHVQGSVLHWYTAMLLPQMILFTVKCA